MIMKSASCFVLAVLTVSQPIVKDGEECCQEKNVGGVRYSFVGETDTKKYGCTSKCTYETDQAPGKKFCFAPGNQKVECLEGFNEEETIHNSGENVLI